MKRNPITNLGYLVKLNPYAKVQRAQTIKEAENAQKRKKMLRERRQAAKEAKAEGKEVPKKERTSQAKKNKDAEAYRKLFVKTLLS
jgi:hypothetical protein